MDTKKIFLVIAVLAVIGFSAATIYQVFYKNQNAFDEKNASVKIEGPQSLESGESFGITISYKNSNKTNLKNAILVLSYPQDSLGEIKDESGFGKINESSVTWDIGDVSGGYEGNVKISAKAASPAANKLTARLTYKPENFSSDFFAGSEYSFTVKPAKISLSLFAPKEVVVGQEAKYTLTYTNTTSLNFGSVRIKLNYPLGFVLSGSIPPIGQDGYWEVPNFTKASSGQIEVAGVWGVSGENVKTMNAVIEEKQKDGKFIFNNEANADTSLVDSPFAINQVINDKEDYSANMNETLNYRIKLRNLDKTSHGNLVVSVSLSGNMGNYSSLAAPGGTIDPATNTVSWDSKSRADLISLEPDKELEFVLSLKVEDKSAIVEAASKDSVDKGTLKNLIIKDTVTIKDGNIFDASGGNKVILSSSFDTKINSSVELFTRGFFNDDGRIVTSGPIPPQVGQTTTYNIHWQVLDYSNKIKDVKVKGVLPANVRWKGEVFPTDAKISYDANTRIITWEAGDLEAGTGFLSPLKEVVFQVSVMPTAKEMGNYMILIDQNSLTATDDFTLREVMAKSEGITTRLPDDVSIGPDEGKVAP